MMNDPISLGRFSILASIDSGWKKFENRTDSCDKIPSSWLGRAMRLESNVSFADRVGNLHFVAGIFGISVLCLQNFPNWRSLLWFLIEVSGFEVPDFVQSRIVLELDSICIYFFLLDGNFLICTYFPSLFEIWNLRNSSMYIILEIYYFKLLTFLSFFLSLSSKTDLTEISEFSRFYPEIWNS